MATGSLPGWAEFWERWLPAALLLAGLLFAALAPERVDRVKAASFEAVDSGSTDLQAEATEPTPR